MKKILFSVLIIFLIALILFFNPLFSNKPVGLDGIGHLSKVSYMTEYPFPSWNMAWYAGTPFLTYYSPAFYYFVALFPNPMFGANFACFLSIVLTCFGVFFLVRHFSKKDYPPLIAGILFLTILSLSYFYIAVGNYPYFFALWTIPFALFLLERSFNSKVFFVLFSLVLALSFLSHVFIGFCLTFLVLMRFLILGGISIKNAKRFFVFILPGFLLSCFWFIPFLTHSSSFTEGSAGYVPQLDHLFGFGNYSIWGIGPGEIGIALILFLFSLSFFFVKKLKKDRYLLFMLLSSVIFFLLLEGILVNFYPTGVGAVRFILPFSILICIFTGLIIEKINLKKQYIAIIFLIVAFGLIWNYNTISTNFTEYDYGGENSRYGFMAQLVQKEDFPIDRDFSNFRFGTMRYVFSEPLNFFLPGKSQTRGYYDQGILYPEEMFLMMEKVWMSHDINSTLFFLDWFGIRYFEIGEEDLEFKEKFEENSDLFRMVMDDTISNYHFIVYEYQDASPIISLLKTNIESVKEIDIAEMAEKNLNHKEIIPVFSSENITITNDYSLLDFEWKREHPDRIEIFFNETEEGNVVLFKEFFHPSWGARELPGDNALKIYRAGPNFMLVMPSNDAEGVIFYQQKTPANYLGIFLTVIGILGLFIFLRKGS